MHYTESLTNYGRNKTMEVTIGNKKIGAGNSIKVQTMCNTPTNEVDKTLAQIANVAKNTKCDIIRVTVPSMSDVENLKRIHDSLVAQGITIPLVADVHFNAEIAFECAKIVEKVRVNPGNFGHHDLACLTEEEFKAEGKLLEDTFRDFLKVCKEHGTAVRIGTNHGSLSKRILNRYGDTPEGMVESVMEFLRVAVEEKFQDIAISLKSSNPTVAIRAARLMVKAMNDEDMHYCLHLGVTEAGEGQEARIKSASGICPLLCDGIGDTIRVSLTEDPENEIEPGIQIAEYAKAISEAEKLPEIPMFYDPYHYSKRKSAEVNGIGGSCVATAAIAIDSEEQLKEIADSMAELQEENHVPDLVICMNDDIASKAQTLLRGIKIATKCGLPGTMKISEANEFTGTKDAALVVINESTNFEKLKNCGLDNVILVAEPQNLNKTAAMRYIFFMLSQLGCNNPVLLKCDGGVRDERFSSFAAAAECAGTFIDGFGDGLALLATKGKTTETIKQAFQILQISRLRISGTEYVSCPGCGRTMYDLQGTVRRIKEATRKYRNIKIAVMGCIVNGPGEMADADFGYVGMGKGKIALYKAGEMVKKGIPEENAVEELIKLIDNSHLS